VAAFSTGIARWVPRPLPRIKGSRPENTGNLTRNRADGMKTRIFLPVFIYVLVCVFSLYGSFQEGYELYKQGKYYDAEKVLLREKEINPNNVDIYAVLGWCYLNTGDYSKAIEISEEGLKLNSKDTRLLTTMGRSYMEMKRYPDALSYLQKSISYNPDYAYSYYYIGRIYQSQGKLILAEAALSASIMLKKDNYLFYKSRAQVYEAMTNHKMAEEDYKKALTLKPNDPALKEALIKVISKQTELESSYQ
jgi:tetratricopeptide (TPR) repeat protein